MEKDQQLNNWLHKLWIEEDDTYRDKISKEYGLSDRDIAMMLGDISNQDFQKLLNANPSGSHDPER